MSKIIIPVVILLVIVLSACQKSDDGLYDCSGTTPTYTSDIMAIINANCAFSGCHESVAHESGIDLSSYAGIKAVSGQPRFLGAIQHQDGFTPMPQGGAKLDEAKQKLLYCWVQSGSPQ